jgi:hypothetical protein
MPYQQWLLVNVPTWFIGVSMLVIAIGTAVAGVLLVRRYVEVSRLKSHHDIAGPIFATVGVVYAVMLSYALVVVWQNFDQCHRNVVMEANYYADILRDSGGLSEPFRSNFKDAHKAYFESVVNDEWKAMALGKRSEKTQELVSRIWELAASYEPANDKEKIFFTEMLSRMNDAGELRRQRLMDARSGIHPMLWFVLLFGGFITIVFAFFFGSENLWAQLPMTVIMAVLVALILFTILIMDFPFSGELSVAPSSFTDVLLNIR